MLKALSLSALLSVAALTSQAATMVYEDTFDELSQEALDEYNNINYDHTFKLPYFDASLGTLTSATIQVDVAGFGQAVVLEQLTPAAIFVNYSISSKPEQNPTGPISVDVAASVSSSGSEAFVPDMSFALVAATAYTITDPTELANLDELTGSGFFDFTATAGIFGNSNRPDGGAAQRFAMGAKITYNYDEPAGVPLPAGAPLLLVGLGALGLARRLSYSH